MIEKKPDVILIGYRRSGSHFLRDYFSHHPDIYWRRGANYFISEDDYGKKHYAIPLDSDGDYKCLIDVSEHLSVGRILKNTADFTKIRFKLDYYMDGQHIDPDPAKIAHRIKDTAPDAKILMILRNQTDWLRSNYMNFIDYLPGRNNSFNDFLSTLEGKMLLFAGLYHNTIKTYIELFGRENVHVMLLERLKESEETSLQELCGFLNVDYKEYSPPDSERNIGRKYTNANAIKILSGLGLSETARGKIKPLLRPFRRIIPGALNKDLLSSRDKSVISSIYSVDNYHLSGLLGIDLGKYGYPL